MTRTMAKRRQSALINGKTDSSGIVNSGEKLSVIFMIEPIQMISILQYQLFSQQPYAIVLQLRMRMAMKKKDDWNWIAMQTHQS